jgi:hypothetical protein
MRRSGSARVPGAGGVVPGSRTSSEALTAQVLRDPKSSFRRDAETSTRDACAPQIGRSHESCGVIRCFVISRIQP